MVMQDLIKAFSTVVSLPYFWNAMSWSTILALLSAATIYDGCVPHAKRGIWSVISYMFTIVLTVIIYAINRYPSINSDVAYQLFIYPVQLILLSFFWLIGFILGIVVFRWVYKTHHFC